MDGLESWETAHNNSETGRVKKGVALTLDFERTVKTFSKSELVLEKDMGVFWPVAIFERIKKKKAKGVVHIMDSVAYAASVRAPVGWANQSVGFGV